MTLLVLLQTYRHTTLITKVFIYSIQDNELLYTTTISDITVEKDFIVSKFDVCSLHSELILAIWI